MTRFALRHSGIERSTLLRGVVDSSSITARFPLSPAHQKQGSGTAPHLVTDSKKAAGSECAVGALPSKPRPSELQPPSEVLPDLQSHNCKRTSRKGHPA